MASDSSKKLFGNCKVEWQIENFSLQTCTKDWFIQSPEFTVKGPEETKWRFYLRPKFINGCSFVLFSVRRSLIDSGAKHVWLNIEIRCKVGDSKSICFKDKLLPVKNRNKYKVSLGSIEYVLTELYKSDKSDLLKIECHMIVYSKSKRRKFGECEDLGIKLLSKNMLDLYTTAQSFDTKFIVGKDVILAHKAILCIRNEYLDCIIDDDDDPNEEEEQELTVIDLYDLTCDRLINLKGMRRVLAYLYTGDIRHVLEEPSFAVQHCASLLEISDIKYHYEPDTLILKSNVDLETHSFILHGYEFGKSFLIWHCYTKESINTFQLLLYSEKYNRKDYICITLFHKTFEQSMTARLEFAFIAESGKKFITHIVTESGIQFIVIDEIIHKAITKFNCTQNIFDVNIKIKLTAGIKTSSMEELNSVSVSCIDGDYYYECLSRDLEFLFDGGPFTDTVIDNNGTYFWVHKCILASRCRLFSDILEENEEGQAIVLSNFQSHTVSVILTYLYSGVLIGAFDDDIIEVYKAAAWSKLFQLQSMCSDWLKTSFKIDRNIRCRIVRIAEEYKDSALMKSVLSDLFFRKEMFLIPNHVSFQDVHACRFCLTEP